MVVLCCTPGGSPDSNGIQLTDRELAVCQAICMSDRPVGFSHVRRSVGLHQEIVSRILRRLVNYNVIKKDDGKYRCGVGQ